MTLFNPLPENEPRGARKVHGTVTPNYLALRSAHFRIMLKTWFRGLDKALLASFAALTFILTAIVTVLLIGLAQALLLLAQPDTGIALRLAVVCGWQAASLLLLRALREATFMPGPRSFFDSLPVPPSHKLRADLLLSLASYSLLWAPLAFALIDPFDQYQVSPATALAALAELAALSLCVNIALLNGAGRQALLAALAGLAYALVGGGSAAAELVRLACALAAGGLLWHSYLPRPARVARPVLHRGLVDKVALGSGLVVPLLAKPLRANLLVRSGAITATLVGCLTVIHLRTNDTSGASVVVFVAAAATIALYSLPALCRSTLLTRVNFLAGQPAFARRMRYPAYGIPALLFLAALACAWPFDRSGRALADASIFGALFVSGVIGARLRWQPTTWLVPFVALVALIILAAMI